MDEDLREGVPHGNNNVAAGLQHAPAFAQFRVAIGLGAMIQVRNEGHRVERGSGEWQVREVRYNVLGGKPFVGEYVNPLTVASTILLQEPVVPPAANVQAVASYFPGNVIEPFGRETRKSPTVFVEERHGA